MLRRKRFWIGLSLSLACLGFFALRTDLSEVRDAFTGVDYLLAVASIILYFLSFWLRTIRWHFILGPVSKVSTARLYPVVLIGLMANNIAPARIGELVRAYLLGERESMSKSTALGTIAVDRAFDGLTLVAMLGTVTLFADVDASIKRIGAATALLFVAATIVLITLAMSPTRARGWLLSIIRRLPAKFATRAAEMLDSFLGGLVALRNPGVLVKAGIASVASWLTEGTMYYIVGQAFGFGVDFYVYLIILSGANLALSVLQTPGGVGPFEVAASEVLVYFGVGTASAAAYAIALHVLLLVPVVIVGFVMVWATQVSFSTLMGVPPSQPPPPPAPPPPDPAAPATASLNATTRPPATE